jgi:restriction system protein
MNSIQAAFQILKNCGQPLHYKEITKRILEKGLWQSTGKTPDATVNSELAKDINKKGVSSDFQRVSEGTYALRSWGLSEFSGRIKSLMVSKKNISSGKAIQSKTMSFNNAAEQVLEEYGNKKPMHYEKITGKILELGLVHTEGQTPGATLYAQILTEIKRNIKKGQTPRFVKYGKGMIGLQKWLGEGLVYQIGTHNANTSNKLHDYLYKIKPVEFEGLVSRLLIEIGFEDVEVTKSSNDGGIDVRATLVVGDVIRTRMAVQVKRWKKNVQSPTVQQVRGSLSAHEQGLIITTSDFSKGAYEEAQLPDKIPVALMNGKQFVALLVENDIGISRTPYDLIDIAELDEENG